MYWAVLHNRKHVKQFSNFTASWNTEQENYSMASEPLYSLLYIKIFDDSEGVMALGFAMPIAYLILV